MEDLSGARVLITGGLGFIGSTLARRIVPLGADVTVLDSVVKGQGGNEFNLHAIAGEICVDRRDLRDSQALRDLIPGQDFIFNLAAQTSHMGSMQDPLTDLDVNARAQVSMLEMCRALNPGVRIVFTSTRQVYGRPRYLPVDENHPVQPVDVNGINKVAGEGFHRLYNDVYGIRSCVLRLTNTYGPRMRVKDATQTFIGLWIRRILEGHEFEVWGGDQLRDFTYVEDAVDALLLAAQDDGSFGQIFNLGGDVLTVRELADALVRTHGGGRFVIKKYPTSRAAIEVGDYRGDFAAITNTLGWVPQTDIHAGLGLTLRYFSDVLDRYV